VKTDPYVCTGYCKERLVKTVIIFVRYLSISLCKIRRQGNSTLPSVL